MEELLRFLATYEVGVYLLFGIIILINLKRLFDAWQLLTKTSYGLEKEVAQKRIRTSLTISILLLLFGLSYFLLITIASVSFPGIARVATPTMDPLAENSANQTELQTQSLPPAQMTQTAEVASGCKPGQLEWIFPEAGETVSGLVEMIGTVNLPNMGFYKYEYKLQGDDIWTPINAGNKPVIEESFPGIWNTEQLNPGNYLLRIVVSDNQNNLLKPCEIEIRIIP